MKTLLLDQVDDSGLLLTLDPTGDGGDEEGTGSDRRALDKFYLALPIKAEKVSIGNTPVDEGLGLVRIFGHDADSIHNYCHSIIIYLMVEFNDGYYG